jgi:hypothetical protein
MMGRAMERRWLVPLSIGGGAVLLVALLIVFGGGTKAPETFDAGAVADDAPPATDASTPAWMNATSAPPTSMPTLTAAQAPTPTAPPSPQVADATVAAPTAPNGVESGVVNNAANGTPIINGSQEQVTAVLQEHISELEKDIAKKEAAGKHDEAERERKSLQRLKGELDMILDGGPP